MKIIFLGAQASGKGTQAILLAKKLNVPHISTGDIFRNKVEEGDVLGKKLESYMDKGKLVPNRITNKVIKDRLQKKDIKKGFILDGYPRTLIQARFLDKIVKFDKVVKIEISDREAVERIKNRRSCECGKTYNLKYNPPKKPEICDLCGDSLFTRDDDKPKAVRKRLSIYHKKIEPLIKYYTKKEILILVNGEQRIEKIHKDILKNLK
jgi:adenylate kinase